MTTTIRSSADGSKSHIAVGGEDRITIDAATGKLTSTYSPPTGERSLALATMQKFADEFGSSLATSGYQKLPSGLIIQWVQGATSTAGEVSEVVTLPITFPNSNLFSSVSSLNAAASTSADTSYQVVSKTTSQVTVIRQQNPGNSAALAPLVFAIGY